MSIVEGFIHVYYSSIRQHPAAANLVNLVGNPSGSNLAGAIGRVPGSVGGANASQGTVIYIRSFKIVSLSSSNYTSYKCYIKQFLRFFYYLIK